MVNQIRITYMYKTTSSLISNSKQNVCLQFAFRCLSGYAGYKRTPGTCNYKLLGVLPGASSLEIKQAYYEKSKQYHPDINSSTDAEVKFQQINDAYEILSNENSRADYDYENGHYTPERTTITNNRHSSQPLQMNEDDKFEKEFVNSAFRNRKIFNRIKRNNENFKGDFQFEQQPDQPFANYITKTEMDFFKNLSPEMKENYQEYLDKLEENKKQMDKEFQETESQNHAVFIVLFSFAIVAIVLELIGNSFGIMKNSDIKVKDSKNLPEFLSKNNK